MQSVNLRPSKSILFIASLSVFFAATAVQADRDFLDDANTRSAGPGSAASLNAHEFPRVFNHEFIGNISNQAAARYMFLDAHGTQFGNMATAKNVYSPQTMLIRHISGRAYQQYSSGYCDISGGPAFETTTNTSQGGPSSAGCGIYAGHWLYEAGTTLRQTVNANATVLPVQDASRFTASEYVVIYNSPAGSFNNAEHAKITAVNNGGRTITVQRGYKSTKSSHNSGSIVAQHVLGQGTEKRLWAFNQSTQSPQDASGKRFWQFYADWIGNNYNRHNSGATAGATIDGIVLDADFYIDLTSKNADHNNDLNTDHGISGSGVNWLGEGLDSFYARIRTRLPNKYLMVGVHDARGFHSAQGAQMENWLDYGNGDYNPAPIYKKLDELFQTYLYNMSDRDQGPTLVHNLTKTPTKQYPGSSSPKPTNNKPFRLGLALTLMEDGYYGTHSAMTTDAWWDEYAVNLNNGQAVNKNDYNGIATHRGWLGQPLGKFKRIYNDANFAPSSSELNNGSFDSNTSSWSGTNVNLSRVTSGTQDGPGAIRVSRMNNYNKSITGASLRSESISITNGATYTLAFSARADDHREIRIDFGGAIDKVPVGPEWRRYVVEMTTNGGSSTLRFNLGRENTQVWFDSIYMFKNQSAHVFKREFENGMALANASTSSKTISVGNGWRRISGTQDPGVNNGNAVSSVTIPAKDGLILIRDGAAAPPPGGGGGGGSGGASLGDLVWQDTDGDGIQDGSESGYGGVNVNLSQCSGGFLASTTTDSNGNYAFSGLAAGSYIVDFERPSGATSSPFRAGSDWGIDSDADEVTGATLCVTLNTDQSKLGVDAGFTPPAGGGGGGGGGSGGSGLGDLVWQDTDGDGIQDGNESGYAGVNITLTTCSGGFLASAVTDSNGNYSFSNLAAGDYMVEFERPSGATSSPKHAGSDWGIDSNADEATGLSLCVNLATDQTKSGVDAGFTPPAGGGGGGSGTSSIGDLVWRDSDSDGIQDGSETGYAGVTVFLDSCSGNTLASTVTDANGSYTFSNIAAGNYQVEFEAPAGATGSPFRAGSDWGVDSDADEVTGATLCISLAAGENKAGVDAGFVPPSGGGGGSGSSGLGDLVWRDSDGDGIQDGSESGYEGVNISLTTCSGNVLATTVTDNNGNYGFSNLAAGDYTVEFERPSGATSSPMHAGSDWGTDSNANEVSGASLCVNLTAGQTKSGVDAGFVPPAGGGGSGNSSIGDLVWRDADGDGIQDGNETGFSGVNVSLNSCSGNNLASTVTDSNGNYAFSNIAAGSYVVSFDQPNNTTTSPFRAGGDFGADSDADQTTGDSLCINLSANESKAGVDAGFVPQSTAVSGANIGDYVWWDEDSDGLQDASEGGVVGVVVQLRWCGNGLADTTTTDSNGRYVFEDLSPGNYKIQVVAPSGATFSPSRRGSDYTADSNAESDGVTSCMSIGQDSSKPHTDIGLIF